MITLLIAYLSWTIPQYIIHRLMHYYLSKPISYGEKQHHKYGKDCEWNSGDLGWINVKPIYIAAIYAVISLIISIFNPIFAIKYLIMVTLMSQLDLHIHKMAHLGQNNFVANYARRLHKIHHKTWKYNYSLFFGIPIDLIARTYRGSK